MVLENVLQLLEENQQGQTHLPKERIESSSVVSDLSSDEFDDVGYAKQIKWITGPGITKEKGTMENPLNR